MISDAVIDAVRYGHLFSVAVGFGASFLADYQVFRRLDRPVSRGLIEQLHLYHGLVWGALVLMWITGLSLVYIRTGFDLAQFSPKLFNKLLIVSMLTMNAMMIGKLAMPLLAQCEGVRLTQLPLSRKLVCGWLASISSASWLLAMALGESKVLAKSDWDLFQSIVPATYIIALFGATAVVLTLHLAIMLRRNSPAI